MKQYIRMMLFVIILGGVTSGLLVGMDLLTKDRIALNKEASIKSAILDAYDISYNLNNIHDIFETEINVIQYEGEDTFYVDNRTGQISYIFTGGGVWGTIRGVITFESDFRTVVNISILEQSETPGLGGVVAERWYLDTYIGTVFDTASPYIIIRHAQEDNLTNEVDAITGGTRTSEKFMEILNTTYEAFKAKWDLVGV